MISGCTVLFGFLQVRFDIRHVSCSQLISVALNNDNVYINRIVPLQENCLRVFDKVMLIPPCFAAEIRLNTKSVYKVISDMTFCQKLITQALHILQTKTVYKVRSDNNFCRTPITYDADRTVLTS